MQNIQNFDTLEIQSCAVIGHDGTGGEIVEPCGPADAAFWTVYGHFRTGGIDAFWGLCDRSRGPRSMTA
ncbi:MAG: hypothetical protein ACLQOO_04820 [Terriglobia bacterium]